MVLFRFDHCSLCSIFSLLNLNIIHFLSLKSSSLHSFFQFAFFDSQGVEFKSHKVSFFLPISVLHELPFLLQVRSNFFTFSLFFCESSVFSAANLLWDWSFEFFSFCDGVFQFCGLVLQFDSFLYLFFCGKLLVWIRFSALEYSFFFLMLI